MIVFLTLLYCGLLFLLLKLNVITMNLWWKLSPAAWIVLLLIGLFIPMQFYAPGGQVLVLQNSVPIVPNVAGQVVAVEVTPNQQVNEGDLLFRIEPEPFLAARDQVAAQLELANIRLSDTKTLREKGAVSVSQLEQDEATVKQLTAALRLAEYNLNQTYVLAPSAGFITNLALRVGARVSSMPMAPAMSLVESGQRLIIAQIPQAYLRHVSDDLEAEVTFKMYPGETFSAKVQYVIEASSQGQVLANGSMVTPRALKATPFAVRLDVAGDLSRLPAGAIGSAAIYTNSGKATHLIRRVMLRMEAWTNYIIPS
jgi:RND family efflux transporter MFP subunit